jgi:hypothetical protein
VQTLPEISEHLLPSPFKDPLEGRVDHYRNVEEAVVGRYLLDAVFRPQKVGTEELAVGTLLTSAALVDSWDDASGTAKYRILQGQIPRSPDTGRFWTRS